MDGKKSGRGDSAGAGLRASVVVHCPPVSSLSLGLHPILYEITETCLICCET